MIYSPENLKPAPSSLRDTIHQRVLEQIRNPEKTVLEQLTAAGYLPQYADNPAGFGEDILHETYTDDVKEVMESVRDNPVTIARSATGVGKTHAAARVAFWFKKTRRGAQVYLGAAPPIANLEQLLWAQVLDVLHKHRETFPELKVAGLKIESSPQEFIIGVTIPQQGTPEEREARFSGKHAPNILFILDESDSIPPEVFKGIEGCLSGGFARLLLMFNPKSMVGPVYQMERDGQGHVVELSALRHPNVTTGRNLFPGAVSREITVRRINEWTRPMTEDELATYHERRKDGKDTPTAFITPKFLLGCVGHNQAGIGYPPLTNALRTIVEPQFYYKVLGQYSPQGESQLISQEWIQAARDRYDLYHKLYQSPPDVQPILGQDVATDGTDKCVNVARYGGYVSMPVKWSGVDPLVTADKAAKIAHETNAVIVFVDANGVGASVAPQLTRLKVNAYGIMVQSTSKTVFEGGAMCYRMRDQLWWATREWLRTDPTAMLPPDEELLEDLQTPKYWEDNGRIRVTDKETMRRQLKRSPDAGDALCLTFGQEEIEYDADKVASGISPCDMIATWKRRDSWTRN